MGFLSTCGSAMLRTAAGETAAPGSSFETTRTDWDGIPEAVGRD
jgi:hypothetical protein